MNKKRILLFTIMIIACLVGYISYIYIKPPTAFLVEDELKAEINRYDNSLQVEKILEQIELNERHYYVPIQFTDGRSGMSFWKWEKGKWQLIQFTTEQVLRWQLDSGDAATNYIVWHRQATQEDEMSIYLVRDRGFFISNDEHRYHPRIQLEHNIHMESYGVEPLPKEWANIITNIEQPYQQSGFSLFETYSTEQYVIGAHYDESMFPENSNSSYWTGNAESTLEYLLYMDENQLE